MKPWIGKNLRSGALLAALAVALVASVVSGREKPGSEPVAEPSVRSASQLALQAPARAEDIDLDKLRRSKNGAPVADLFAPADPPAMHAPGRARRAGKDGDASSAGAAAPEEPPLPFQYLGKVIDAGKLSVFLSNGTEHYSVQAGHTIDGRYRVDQVSEASVSFTHLPTGTRKVLAIPALH